MVLSKEKPSIVEWCCQKIIHVRRTERTMSKQSSMNLNERYTYLQVQSQRYQQAGRAEKSRLLDEMMEVTGLSRNHLIELMSHPPRRKPRTKQRGPSYGPETDAVLRIIWEALNYICAERLHPVLLKTAQALARFGDLQLTPALEHDLKTISVATLRRHLPSTTKPVSRWRKSRPRLKACQQGVPARPIPWTTTEPGHLEVDTVLHCGEKAEGEFVVSLVVVDVATGWMQARAVLGRSSLVIADAFYALFQLLPFVVHEIHPDNGSEFFNALVVSTLQQLQAQLLWSRSRPAHPNDNRFIEERNGSVIRAWLGRRRLDTVTQTRYLNTLYTDLLCPYVNLVLPQMRQRERQTLPATETQPVRIVRRHDQPQTPLDRLLTTAQLRPEFQDRLRAQQQALNPLALKRALDQAVTRLFTYPLAAPEQPENIYHTLAYPELFPEACAALDLPYASNPMQVLGADFPYRIARAG